MPATIPSDLHYTKSHEYVRLDGNQATVGVTAYAAEQLGDIVFVELPEVGKEIKKGDTFGVIESVKAVSDLYSPVSGKIVEVNDKLDGEPSLVNDEAFGNGWIIKVELTNPSELDETLNPQAYEALLAAH